MKFWEHGNATIHHEDCLSVLKAMPCESVDSIVTDPPAGIAFMNRHWDDFRGREHFVEFLCSVMRECLRILKPGGHAVVWAFPRTSHWTATAIEDAGFEIRDVIMHVFGSGFPKSMDVSKAIDDSAGVVREAVPLVRVDGRVQTDANSGSWAQGSKKYAHHPVSEGSTDLAKKWDGWGTGLKPAAEHWIMARKPLIGTFAENLEKHGVGAINIDDCRIPLNGRFPANVIMDRTSGEILDEQSGGASRFFYCSKTSAADRGPDCKHPTVKPTELMRYLCQLVTPPGGLIVDPFFGSGSTGRGAILEGFRIIGIEGELKYCRMAKRRVKFVQDGRYMADE